MSKSLALVAALLELLVALIAFLRERQADRRRDEDKRMGRVDAYLEASQDAKQIIEKARQARRDVAAARALERVHMDPETGAGDQAD